MELDAQRLTRPLFQSVSISQSYLSALSFPCQPLPLFHQLFRPNSAHFLCLQYCQNAVAQQSRSVVLEIDFVLEDVV